MYNSPDINTNYFFHSITYAMFNHILIKILAHCPWESLEVNTRRDGDTFILARQSADLRAPV